MSASTTAEAPAPTPETNRLGLDKHPYEGADSTLCVGCGHDAITAGLIQAFWEMGVEPHRVAKMSGIGCSSKTTAYFLRQSHGFNAVHGRMAAIATGVRAANRTLINVGVSGDGDTASIGLGNFLHMVRRNVPIIYVIENNGVYGLTKGQFSATADEGSLSKHGAKNEMPALDCCALAIEMGCGFVARSFSGDRKQVLALLKAAVVHPGTSVLDIVSPCVTFNNHEGSTKSFTFAKKNEDPLHDLGFVPYFQDIAVDYDAGTTQVVRMHDGSKITLAKLAHDYDPTDRMKALTLLREAEIKQHFYTGLIYYNGAANAMEEQMHFIETPLATIDEALARPKDGAFEELMNEYR